MEETPPRFCQWPFHLVVDPGFRLRGRNFKHAPRIVFSRPSQLKLIFQPIHSRMYQRMHMTRMVEIWNEGLIFPKFLCIVLVVEFKDEYRGED